MNEPKLRFKKDDGSRFPDWKEKKLGDITEKVVRKDENSTADIRMISQGNGFILQSDKYSKENAGQSLKKYTLLKRDEFAYNHGASKVKPYGVCYRLCESDEARVPYVYHTFKLIDDDSNFWNYALNTSYMDRQLKKMVSSGARMDGLLNIGYDTYMSINVHAPSLPEQHKIASLFTELDTLIQSAEKELEGYRELKQGMLQKMFPKKGEATPEIRFPEFTGDWEHRKFGEVLETVTDYVAAGSFADLAKNVEYKDYPDYAQLIRTMDLKNEFTSAQEVYVDKNAFDYLHRVNMDKECIILPNIGNCGEVYYVKPESLPYEHNVLGPNAIFVRSETCANNFLSILLQAKDFQTKLKLIVSPNGQTKFNKTELKGIDLILPGNVYEQEKIGQYFENLDSLIALQQKEIDGYKELKKGLLQQMFC